MNDDDEDEEPAQYDLGYRAGRKDALKPFIPTFALVGLWAFVNHMPVMAAAAASGLAIVAIIVLGRRSSSV